MPMKPRRTRKGASERAQARAKRAEIEAQYQKLEGKRIAAIGDAEEVAKIKAAQAILSEQYYSTRTRKPGGAAAKRKGGGGSSILALLGR
jgi:hypothetical protein